jgi:hypothetical protein
VALNWHIADRIDHFFQPRMALFRRDIHPETESQVRVLMLKSSPAPAPRYFEPASTSLKNHFLWAQHHA